MIPIYPDEASAAFPARRVVGPAMGLADRAGFLLIVLPVTPGLDSFNAAAAAQEPVKIQSAAERLGYHEERVMRADPGPFGVKHCGLAG